MSPRKNISEKFSALAMAGIFTTSLGLALAPPASATGEVLRVPGVRYDGGPAAKREAYEAKARRRDPAAPIEMAMRLGPLTLREKGRFTSPTGGKRLAGSRMQIGIHREIPEELTVAIEGPDLVWEAARGGGEAAVFSIASPGARAVRAALEFHRLPKDAEVRFYAPGGSARPVGPFEAGFLTPVSSLQKSSAAAELFWSPAIEGEELAVEIWVPRWEPRDAVSVSLRKVSHINVSIAPKDLSHLGRSGACEKDVACFKKWRDAGDAVAKLIFESGDGGFLCTGELVNDGNPKTVKFYMLTAGHCIQTKPEAKSTTFFWFFERQACDGDDPTEVVQTGGGAKLKYTSGPFGEGTVSPDTTLLKLRRRAPDGVTLLGFSLEEPAEHLDAKVHGIHHPSGDVKMASRGKVKELHQIDEDGFVLTEEPFTHYRVKWGKGTTEGGSSGSAILVGKRWPKQFVIGVLSGGLASCQARGEPDYYGMFIEAWNRSRKMRRILDPN